VRFLIWQQTVRPDGITEEVLEKLADALANIEESDPAIAGVDIAASLASGTVDVQMCVVAPDADQALARSQAAIRDAIQAIGDLPPGLASTRLLHAEPIPA
jgi:hypothetical protein